MKKQKTTRKKAAPKLANASTDKMGHAIATFLQSKGWDAFVVGPCEIRTGAAVGNDMSGHELRQYEFIAKFYGKRSPVSPCP